MDKYLIGIDLGTSGCKTAVFDRTGQVMGTSSAPYPVYYPQSGWAEQDPNEWWAGACKTIHEALMQSGVHPDQIAGIGTDGQSWSAVAIDRKGKVLTNTPIWMDTRSEEICRRWKNSIGEKEIFRICGNSMQPTYTTAKIKWYQENLPEIYAATDKILQSNSYLVYKLTGNITQDISQGYGWHCFDMRHGRWDYDMCRKLGIPSNLLPKIMACDTVAGRVTAQAAVESGLNEGTPVVAGGLDAACGALGSGVLNEGETQEQGGQAEGMSICLESYKADPRLILSFHVVPGKWLLQGGTVGGGGVLRWFASNFAEYEKKEADKTGKSVFAQLDELADQIAPGSNGLVFLPYMSGERSPIWNPSAKGIFYGLDYAKTKGHLVRACMEGVAYSLRHNIETAELAGASVSSLKAMGGSANSKVWTQIKSNITGKPVSVPSSDTATTLGAALLAGVGTGVFKSYEEAVKLTVRDTFYYMPDQKTADVYQNGYSTYKKIYEALKPLMQ